jgi:hypothetical protein
MINNSCHLGALPGLIFIEGNVELFSCVFQSNDFDAFVGSGSFPGYITFINCAFDIQSLNKTNSVVFSTTMCTFVPQPTSLPQCANTATNPSKTPSQNPTPSHDVSRTLIVVNLVLDVVIIIALVVLVVVVIFYRRRRPTAKSHELISHAESSYT